MRAVLVVRSVAGEGRPLHKQGRATTEAKRCPAARGKESGGRPALSCDFDLIETELKALIRDEGVDTLARLENA